MTKRRNHSADRAAGRIADQLAQMASGITAAEGTGAPAIRPQEEDDDLIARNSEAARATPRRYEHAAAEDE